MIPRAASGFISWRWRRWNRSDRLARGLAGFLTALVLLGPQLDANYVAITESPHQERLFQET